MSQNRRVSPGAPASAVTSARGVSQNLRVDAALARVMCDTCGAVGGWRAGTPYARAVPDGATLAA
ncbi:exported hypothetical protein [uncultured Microbacterium sp.]|uniref:Uncharacterized protein n=1 Tax=uncultured Microbacterium sp. TaxID=191216 RepID=A0A1Y5PB12_9MICO|nr:exported hypothetical protein [uncultured Microbacterium sp.]